MLRGLFPKILHANPDRLLVRVSTPVHEQVNIYQYTGKKNSRDVFWNQTRQRNVCTGYVSCIANISLLFFPPFV